MLRDGVYYYIKGFEFLKKKKIGGSPGSASHAVNSTALDRIK